MSWCKLNSNNNGPVSLSSAEASLCCREAREKEKESVRGTMGRGKREERPLPYNLCFSGRICGFVVLAKPADYLVPRALSIFSIIAIFIGIPSGSLCGGERSSFVIYIILN